VDQGSMLGSNSAGLRASHHPEGDGKAGENMTDVCRIAREGGKWKIREPPRTKSPNVNGTESEFRGAQEGKSPTLASGGKDFDACPGGTPRCKSHGGGCAEPRVWGRVKKEKTAPGGLQSHSPQGYKRPRVWAKAHCWELGVGSKTPCGNSKHILPNGENSCGPGPLGEPGNVEIMRVNRIKKRDGKN